ncbi:hypothetical protein BJV82DRAFT_675799 [Fennellomyces sp. T-0311]|nr:hypothetical protein BJV82DRAFT_675799 [Fennellomyces sp. T-0311]
MASSLPNIPEATNQKIEQPVPHTQPSSSLTSWPEQHVSPSETPKLKSILLRPSSVPAARASPLADQIARPQTVQFSSDPPKVYHYPPQPWPHHEKAKLFLPWNDKQE